VAASLHDGATAPAPAARLLHGRARAVSSSAARRSHATAPRPGLLFVCSLGASKSGQSWTAASACAACNLRGEAGFIGVRLCVVDGAYNLRSG
jgi:hypothetical protein